MNQISTHDNVTPAASTKGGRTRSVDSAPRRWWRAVDQLTLETMNPPVPAHVRAALYDSSGAVRPEPSVPADGGRHVNQNLMPGLTDEGATMTTETTTFATTIRTAAPGRSERVERLDQLSNQAFSEAIRAGAPGRTTR